LKTNIYIGLESNLSNLVSKIHDEIQEFVLSLVPKAETVSNFNGNFVFLLPLEGIFIII
jgi:hypothetical protein